jgi:2,3-bisphosphoglycerate-dependent phosphoglycerate mutase
MTSTLYLGQRSCIAILRHGDYEQPPNVPSAHLPHPLTKTGDQQSRVGAQKILQWIKEHGYVLDPTIHCSSLLRAYQTASNITEVMEVAGHDVFNILEHDDLSERCVGAGANLTVSEIEAILDRDPRYQKPAPGWKSNSWFRLPFQGAESLMESGLRVAHHLQRTAADLDHGPKRLKIIVGHGASIRHAALCLGLLKSSDIPKLSMHHAEPLFISRSPTGQWEHWGGEWKIRKPKDKAMD